MCLAIQAVKDGSNISQAACVHGVPHTTLYDRISGRVSHGVNPSPKPYLSKFEEKGLLNFWHTYIKLVMAKVDSK